MSTTHLHEQRAADILLFVHIATFLAGGRVSTAGTFEHPLLKATLHLHKEVQEALQFAPDGNLNALFAKSSTLQPAFQDLFASLKSSFSAGVAAPAGGRDLREPSQSTPQEAVLRPAETGAPAGLAAGHPSPGTEQGVQLRGGQPKAAAASQAARIGVWPRRTVHRLGIQPRRVTPKSVCLV